MSTQYRFIQPLDILNFRGNKSFGEAGEHGESQMPPQPSIFAGALRSNWLAQQKIDLAAFANNKPLADNNLHQQLGTPEKPGSFRIQGIWLAKRTLESTAIADLYMPLPADVLALESAVHILKPLDLPAGLQSSSISSSQAVLKASAEKPKSGFWLNRKGMQAYLRGETLNENAHLITSSKLWQTDARLGIALQTETRTAEEGKIYTTESIAMEKNTGFVAVINGAADFPPTGSLRLGGDGRAASMAPCALDIPQPDWPLIEKSGQFKLILSTPALFKQGWQLPNNGESLIRLGDGTATLACAAVGRFGVISGWDLAKWQPKDAERVTPAGSVYWLKDFTGSITSLQKLMQAGIGLDTLDPTRCAEGYNNFLIANWN